MHVRCTLCFYRPPDLPKDFGSILQKNQGLPDEDNSLMGTLNGINVLLTLKTRVCFGCVWHRERSDGGDVAL